MDDYIHGSKIFKFLLPDLISNDDVRLLIENVTLKLTLFVPGGGTLYCAPLRFSEKCKKLGRD